MACSSGSWTRSVLTLVGVFLALSCLGGCASVTSLQTAHTVGKGRWQLGVELSEQAMIGRDSVTAYPMSGIAGRYGITDRIDVGAKVGPSGIELLGKFQLTPPPPNTVVSIAPHAAIYAWDPGGLELRSYNVGLPVLVGINLPHEHQLILGPKVHNMFFSVAAGSARGFVDTTSLGGTVGVAWKMPTTKTSVRIVTELGALYPLLVYADRYDGVGGVAWSGTKWTLQANVGFLLGGS